MDIITLFRHKDFLNKYDKFNNFVLLIKIL